MGRRSGQVIPRGIETKTGKPKWLIKWYAGEVLNPETGRRKRHYSSRIVSSTKKEAEAELRKELDRVETGGAPVRSKQTVGDFLGYYLDHVAPKRVKPRWLRDQRYLLRKYVSSDPIWTRRLDRTRREHVQVLIDKLGDQGFAWDTLRLVRSALSAGFRYAVEEARPPLLLVNPATGVKLPRRTKRSGGQAMTEEELERFLRAAQRSRYAAFFQLQADLGARPSEALALAWKHVDLKRGTVLIERTLPDDLKSGEPLRFEGTKNEKRRTVRLQQETVEMLKSHRKDQAIEWQRPLHGEDLLFTTRKGGHVRLGWFGPDVFKRTLKRAGLPKSFRLYDLRHTVASLLLRGGVDQATVAAHLGDTVEVLYRTYAHVIPSGADEIPKALREARERGRSALDS